MSREIKFRVWDIYQKRWCLELNYISLGISSGAVVESWEDGYNIYPVKDFVVQQYVGLKDKNGVEIYEGDILSIKSYYGWNDTVGYYYKATVWYDESQAKFVSSPKPWLGGGRDFSHSLSDERDVEVIGNIFENPELKYEQI